MHNFCVYVWTYQYSIEYFISVNMTVNEKQLIERKNCVVVLWVGIECIFRFLLFYSHKWNLSKNYDAIKSRKKNVRKFKMIKIPNRFNFMSQGQYWYGSGCWVIAWSRYLRPADNAQIVSNALKTRTVLDRATMNSYRSNKIENSP